ncbi:MAG TPA: DUF4954 family protein, partial [Flavisolibacter sp.]|nr:DUF4954 family protein [Flavisolibacter sp.]
GDAWLWSKYRDDEELMNKFKEFTERKFDKQRGYYGKIGDNCVIKNTAIVKDVWVGPNAYIKGANKLKNLTINSSPEAPSQIGEGCELVNGIIGFGCRIFYGVKAVRFFMASHSQLKYGARLINSYLGNNSTISCCEVLNSLIFPFHEQHHNNSFLIAATVMGQSNIAAGATLGSNHNSRAADGEMTASRGFWPGLCVSLMHNSKFASFTLIAKGDYPAELNVPLPFSLISNDVSANALVVMPAYWFMYNLYALARNAAKYADRDKRTKKIQYIEYNYLAPDSINEIFTALDLLRKFTAKAAGIQGDEPVLITEGERLLNDAATDFKKLEIVAEEFECTKRPVKIIKAKEAYHIYKNLVVYYGIELLVTHIHHDNIDTFEDLVKALPQVATQSQWMNLGGQLVPADSLQTLFSEIKSDELKSWNGVHQFYQQQGKVYPTQKLQHAFSSLLKLLAIDKTAFTPALFRVLLGQAVETKNWMTDNIYSSRAKDHESEFRKMTYANQGEMEKVVGRLEENVFINQQREELNKFIKKVKEVEQRFQL